MSHVDHLTLENRRLRDEIDRLQRVIVQQNREASNPRSRTQRDSRSPYRDVRGHVSFVENYDSSQRNKGVGFMRQLKQKDQRPIEQAETRYNSLTTSISSNTSREARSALARKFSELRARDLPDTPRSQQQQKHSSSFSRRGLGKVKSQASYEAQLHLYKKLKRPLTYSSAAQLNNQTFSPPDTQTFDFNQTLRPGEDHSPHRIGSRKRFLQIPLQKELEEIHQLRSPQPHPPQSYPELNNEQEYASVVSFNPSPVKRSQETRATPYEEEINSVAEGRFNVPKDMEREIQKIELKTAQSRSEAITPNFTDLEKYRRLQAIQELAPPKQDSYDLRPQRVFETRKSAPITNSWQADPYECPQEDAPRPPPPAPNQLPYLEASGPQKFGIKSPNSSWDISPMTELPPSVQNSLVFNATLAETAGTGGLIKLIPARKGETPGIQSMKNSPPRQQTQTQESELRDTAPISTYRTNYALHLEPVTAQSPDILSDTQQSFSPREEPLDSHMTSSVFGNSSSIVQSGSPQNLQKQLSLEPVQKPEIQVEENRPLIPSFKSPANRYELQQLSEQQFTPLSVSPHSTVVDRAKKVQTPPESTQDYESPLRQFQKQVGIEFPEKILQIQKDVWEEMEKQPKNEQMNQEIIPETMEHSFTEPAVHEDRIRRMPVKVLEGDVYDLQELPQRKKREFSPLQEVQVTNQEKSPDIKAKKVDRLGLKEREQRLQEITMRRQALSIRKSAEASPIRVSGGMTRKPNHIITRQKQEKLILEKVEERKDSTPTKGKIGARRGSAQKPSVGPRAASKKNLKRSQSKSKSVKQINSMKTAWKEEQVAQVSAKRVNRIKTDRLETLEEQNSSNMTTQQAAVEQSKIQENSTTLKTESDVSQQTKTLSSYQTPSKIALQKRRQNSQIIANLGSLSASQVKQHEFQKPSMFANLYGKPVRVKHYVPHALKAHSQNQSGASVKEKSMSALTARRGGSSGQKKREGSVGVSPFVLAKTKRGQSPGGGRHCQNCVQLMMKGLSSAYCTKH